MLVEEIMPVYDVSDGVAVLAKAGAADAWEALLDVDLIEVGRRRPVVGLLGALRTLPEVASRVIHGEPPPRTPEHLRLRDMPGLPVDQGGWTLLGEAPGEEIALGLVGKFWRPVIEFAQVPAEAFRDFAAPGYAKTVYALSVRPLGPDETLLSGTMRTATTDEHARRWFMRYWTFGVGSGAHILVQGLLDAAREDAERRDSGSRDGPSAAKDGRDA